MTHAVNDPSAVNMILSVFAILLTLLSFSSVLC